MVDEELGESEDAGATAVGERSVVPMEGVEHLGRYVFEMTKAVVESRASGGGDAVEARTTAEDAEVGDGVVGLVDDRDVDEVEMDEEVEGGVGDSNFEKDEIS